MSGPFGAIEIRRPERRKPTETLPDPGRGRGAPEPVPVGAPHGQSGPEGFMGLDGEYLGPPVAVEIGQSRRGILEDHRPVRGGAQTGPAAHVNGQGGVFHLITERAVGVATGRILVARANGGLRHGARCKP
jgi:hypothetical protein